MQLDSQQKHILKKAIDGKSLFITGPAGTGKSFLLKYIVHALSQRKKRIVITAPTGTAAIKVSGATLHSFFGWTPDTRLGNCDKRLPDIIPDVLIIDEVSMVRSDTMDMIDYCCRKLTRQMDVRFGGIQLIMFGDLYQLPPVCFGVEREFIMNHYDSEFFFSANCFSEDTYDAHYYETVHLSKIYRQDDDEFVNLLNAIRVNENTTEALAVLNKRVGAFTSRDSNAIVLATKNSIADQINAEAINELKGAPRLFIAETEGKIPTSHAMAPDKLILKIGSRVMFCRNDQNQRWANGTMGTVVAFNNINGVPLIELDDSKQQYFVEKVTWDLYTHSYQNKKQLGRAVGKNATCEMETNEEDIIDENAIAKQLKLEPSGTYTQIPLRPANAITIHKSQGATLDEVIISLGNGAFADGQTYVALSRCRTLEGISLISPIREKDIMVSNVVKKFMAGDYVNRS